jgi:thiol-disulfide isomerase/thioredoxin
VRCGFSPRELCSCCVGLGYVGRPSEGLVCCSQSGARRHHRNPGFRSATWGTRINSRVLALVFTITDLNGETIALSQFRGKVVLLDFWAVDCGGCKVEIPWYIAFDASSSGTPSGAHERELAGAKGKQHRVLCVVVFRVDGLHRVQNHLTQNGLSLRESERQSDGRQFNLNERGAHCQPTSPLLLQFKKCHKLWHFSRAAAERHLSIIKAV